MCIVEMGIFKVMQWINDCAVYSSWLVRVLQFIPSCSVYVKLCVLTYVCTWFMVWWTMRISSCSVLLVHTVYTHMRVRRCKMVLDCCSGYFLVDLTCTVQDLAAWFRPNVGPTSWVFGSLFCCICMYVRMWVSAWKLPLQCSRNCSVLW